MRSNGILLEHELLLRFFLEKNLPIDAQNQINQWLDKSKIYRLAISSQECQRVLSDLYLSEVYVREWITETLANYEKYGFIHEYNICNKTANEMKLMINHYIETFPNLTIEAIYGDLLHVAAARIGNILLVTNHEEFEQYKQIWPDLKLHLIYC